MLKLDGIVLFTNINDIYLGDKRFDPVFDELNRRDAVVFVHPVAPPGFDINRLEFPAPAIEFPFETTRMIMNMIGSGTLRRCPRVRMIVAHGGGTLPFLAPRISRNLVRFGKVSPAFTPDEVLAAFRSLYYDVTGVSHRNAIDALLTLAPPDHLLYGSDHPFMLSTLIPPAIDFVMSYPSINETNRQALAFGNALGLFPRIAAPARYRFTATKSRPCARSGSRPAAPNEERLQFLRASSGVRMSQGPPTSSSCQAFSRRP